MLIHRYFGIIGTSSKILNTSFFAMRFCKSIAARSYRVSGYEPLIHEWLAIGIAVFKSAQSFSRYQYARIKMCFQEIPYASRMLTRRWYVSSVLYLVIETSTVKPTQIRSDFIFVTIRTRRRDTHLIYVTFSDVTRSFWHSFRDHAWYQTRSFVRSWSRRACRRIQAEPFSPLTVINRLEDN